MIEIDPAYALFVGGFCSLPVAGSTDQSKFLALGREVSLRQSMQRHNEPSVKKRLLRPIEVETEYGLPVGELAKKRVAGGGDAPPFLRFGRSIYYDREDLERWITSSKRNSTSDPGTNQAETR